MCNSIVCVQLPRATVAPEVQHRNKLYRDRDMGFFFFILFFQKGFLGDVSSSTWLKATSTLIPLRSPMRLFRAWPSQNLCWDFVFQHIPICIICPKYKYIFHTVFVLREVVFQPLWITPWLISNRLQRCVGILSPKCKALCFPLLSSMRFFKLAKLPLSGSFTLQLFSLSPDLNNSIFHLSFKALIEYFMKKGVVSRMQEIGKM